MDFYSSLFVCCLLSVNVWSYPTTLSARLSSMPTDSDEARRSSDFPATTRTPIGSPTAESRAFPSAADQMPRRPEQLSVSAVDAARRILRRLPNETERSRVSTNGSGNSRTSPTEMAGDSNLEEVMRFLGVDAPNFSHDRHRRDNDDRLVKICNSYVEEAIGYFQILKSMVEEMTFSSDSGNPRWCPFKVKLAIDNTRFPPVQLDSICNTSCHCKDLQPNQTGDFYCGKNKVTIPVLKKVDGCTDTCCNYEPELVVMKVGCSCLRSGLEGIDWDPNIVHNVPRN